MEKTILLEMLTANHTRFSSLLSQVSEKKMLEPLDEVKQTGKDIVAHITA